MKYSVITVKVVSCYTTITTCKPKSSKRKWKLKHYLINFIPFTRPKNIHV